MFEMDAETLLELRALRVRAYGPAADIDQDPAAVDSLRELEALNGESEPAVPAAVEATIDAQPEPETQPESLPEPRIEAEPALSVSTEERPEDLEAPPESSSRPRRRDRKRSTASLPLRTRVLWALSVVASGALAVAITYALVSVSPVSASSGARQIATLKPSALADIPAGWFGAGPSSVTWEFYGLTLFETTGGYSAVGSECFTAIATEQLPKPDTDPNSWSINGFASSGCRIRDFPATVQMTVDSNAPEDMRAKFPERSALQFVRDGDRIGVFLSSD